MGIRLTDDHQRVYDMNKYSFVILNWLELIILVFMIYKIRNVKDELNIKSELIWIMAFWILFSFGYFITLTSSHTNSTEVTISKWAYFTIFAFIQFRNLSTMAIQTFYCYRTSRNPDLSYD